MHRISLTRSSPHMPRPLPPGSNMPKPHSTQPGVAAATLRVSIPELQAHSDELVIKQMDALRASDRKRHKSVMAQIERVNDTLVQHVTAKSWGG